MKGSNEPFEKILENANALAIKLRKADFVSLEDVAVASDTIKAFIALMKVYRQTSEHYSRRIQIYKKALLIARKAMRRKSRESFDIFLELAGELPAANTQATAGDEA